MTDQPIDPTVQRLGEAFAAACKEQFGAEKMAEIRRRNALPAYEAACATHDFADANMIMDEAFTGMMGRPLLPDEGEATDADIDLWNAAWDYARETHLTEKAA